MLDLAHRLAKLLEPWFLQHQRDLAWRRTRDPYAIWVSEIMLQQTRVDTVEQYYGKFLERFPDIGTLAAADESEVLAAWSGLGYYRRARLLHAGARHVAASHGGKVPDDPELLRQIPGVGRYTAGAIASIAFDRPTALVDGNVARVLSRLQAIEDPKLQEAGAPGHWTMAQQIVQAGPPRVLAQALMELGATVCTPLGPRCEGCPVRSECQALAKGLQTTIPKPKQRAPSPRDDLWAVAVRRNGRVLLEQRANDGLLAGMWCLPLIERKITDRAGAPPRAIAEVTGVKVKSVEALTEPVKHVFTHRVWMLWPCRGEAAVVDVSHMSGYEDGPGRMWIAPGERPRGGIPKVTEKVLERLGY